MNEGPALGGGRAFGTKTVKETQAQQGLARPIDRTDTSDEFHR